MIADSPDRRFQHLGFGVDHSGPSVNVERVTRFDRGISFTTTSWRVRIAANR